MSSKQTVLKLLEDSRYRIKEIQQELFSTDCKIVVVFERAKTQADIEAMRAAEEKRHESALRYFAAMDAEIKEK